MSALAYLALLLPVAAVAWIVWSYRRKAVEKDAKSRERAAALLGLPAATGGGRAGVPPGKPVSPIPAPAPAIPVAAQSALRERFLSPPETLAYYLLRAGLPGHEVFPHVSLGAVLAAGAVPGETRRRFEQHDLEFVVCDKGLRVRAVVRLGPTGAADRAAWADTMLATAGVRIVVLDPGALPRREEVPALVLAAAP
ncbi:MAG: DUF2726 domain-containing protein [Burkholderiales bacterium]|nr:DUF2726 domain-containing protein [Burkholderiales bacterium]